MKDVEDKELNTNDCPKRSANDASQASKSVSRRPRFSEDLATSRCDYCAAGRTEVRHAGVSFYVAAGRGATEARGTGGANGVPAVRTGGEYTS